MKKLDKRRRREGKTNYQKRLSLLKSESRRLVVRKTNKYLILQIVESEKAQDKVIYSVSTKELLKREWPEDKKGSLKSLAAAYLAGLLIGKKGIAGKSSKDESDKVGKSSKDDSGHKDTGRVILDSGLIPSTKGSRVYAAVKGVSDAGLEIAHSEDILPSDERINKFDFFDKVKEAIK